jgi:hypothetical protein
MPTAAANPAAPAWRRRVRRAGLALAGLLLLLAGALAVEHRLARPDFLGFAPAAMGRQEAAMWRHYYEGRWCRLGVQALTLARRQFGFSCWDSARLAFHAARAAARFRADTHDPRCLPELERYYAIVRRALGREFDIRAAARLELDWWQERRRGLGPAVYARTIARLTALVYGVDEAAVLEAATLRAEAMATRDAQRHGRMTDADWAEIARLLTDAYARLKDALATAPPGTDGSPRAASTHAGDGGS